MTILILAPHTDDEVFGCGATIARFVEEGHDVHCACFSVCMLSVPEPWPADQLIQEWKSATAVLGVKSANLHPRDFQVRTFDRHRQEILDQMIRLRERVKPNMVLMPWRHDVHQDHQVIAEEGIRAFKHCTIMCYELPWNVVDTPFPADSYIELSIEQVQKKRDAIARYATQTERRYARPETMNNRAFARGLEAGLDFAEAFHTVRMTYPLTER